MIGRRVKYHTKFGLSSTGIIIQYFELTGVFIVEDEQEGTVWSGWQDQLEFLKDVAA